MFPFSSRCDSQYIDRVAIPEFKRINRELHAVFRYVGTLSFICPEEKLNENGPSNSVDSLASESTQLISSELKSPRGDYDDYLRLLRAEFDLQVLSSHFFYFSQNPFPFSLSHVTSQQHGSTAGFKRFQGQGKRDLCFVIFSTNHESKKYLRDIFVLTSIELPLIKK